MSSSQTGFTLLEVVVAIAVVGAGFAAGLAAMSGSLRLMRSSDEYEQGMLLARAALTEALAYPDLDIADEREREIYQGVEYGYKVEFRPVRLAEAAAGGTERSPVSDGTGPAGSLDRSPLEQISVDVYWGKGRSYRLVTYRRTATAAAALRSRGNVPASDSGGAPKDGGVASGVGRPIGDSGQRP